MPVMHYLRQRERSALSVAAIPTFQSDNVDWQEMMAHYQRNRRMTEAIAEAIAEAFDIADQPDDPHMLNLAGMQEEEHQNLYVDAVHYNPYFNDRIAARIAERVHQLLAFPATTPTGRTPRLTPSPTHPVQTR